jgi:type IV pilus assembly protein PilQ
MRDRLDLDEPDRVEVGGTVGGAGTVMLGAAAGSIFSKTTTGATSGIGIIYNLGTNKLKAELDAMESEGLTTTLSNPKIFTLNNQTAKITQGTQIPYQVAAEGANISNTQFVDAALSLEVTPSIVGDGNIILDLIVNNDSIGTVTVGTQPTIDKMEIRTKLLVEDGSIVVIGGIFSDKDSKTKALTPGLGRLPIIGGLFRHKLKDVEKTQLLVFIAPRMV